MKLVVKSSDTLGVMLWVVGDCRDWLGSLMFERLLTKYCQ
jgi:hypothetical protein